MDEAAIVMVFTHMLRAGILPEDVIHDAADELAAAGKADSARYLRCLPIEARQPPLAERAGAFRRSTLKAVDGGKSD